MVEKRFVSINPDFLKLGGATNRGTRKNRPDSNSQRPLLKVKTPPKPAKEKNAKTIKKNLLNYIRQQQQKNYDELIKPRSDVSQTTPKHIDTTATHIASDFKDSLDYLMKFTKETENKNRTLKSYHTTKPNENVSLSLPLEFVTPPPPPANSSPVHIRPPPIPTLSPLPTPQYGCLKGGTLPTYRTWHNRTQKNYGTSNHNGYHIAGSTHAIMPTTAKDELLQKKVEELKQRSVINTLASSPVQKVAKIAQINYGKKLKEQETQAKKRRVPKRQKTMRRTYRVGRSKIAPKVSVLVSNKTIRKNIYTQALLLKQTPIKEVKRYLIKQGFIRVGSIAPNDILRRMYENAKLVCGELRNHNPDNLLYNFLNGADGEN